MQLQFKPRLKTSPVNPFIWTVLCWCSSHLCNHWQQLACACYEWHLPMNDMLLASSTTALFQQQLLWYNTAAVFFMLRGNSMSQHFFLSIVWSECVSYNQYSEPSLIQGMADGVQEISLYSTFPVRIHCRFFIFASMMTDLCTPRGSWGIIQKCAMTFVPYLNPGTTTWEYSAIHEKLYWRNSFDFRSL